MFPKHRLVKFGCQGITQRKECNEKSDSTFIADGRIDVLTACVDGRQTVYRY
jgi:hypothetical protein